MKKNINIYFSIKYVALIIILTASKIMVSQTDNVHNYKIKGVIVDSLENKPVGYVNVVLLSSKDSLFLKSGMTNENGDFIIEDIKSGEYLLRIINFEYKPIYKSISLQNDLDLKLFLSKVDIELGEITVKVKKDIYIIEPDKRVYLTSNDESIKNAFAEDAIENAPGAYIDTDGNVIVRGKPATVWINGSPSNKNKNQIQNYLKTIPATRIDRIEVITNPSAEFSASNMNSIINIVLKKKEIEESLFAGGLVYNTSNKYGAWVTAYISRKKFDINVYASGSTSKIASSFLDQNYSTNEEDTIYFVENDRKDTLKSYQGFLHGEFSYNPGNSTTISAAILSGLTHNDEFSKSSLIRKYSDSYSYFNEISTLGIDKVLFGRLDLEQKFKKKGHKLFVRLLYQELISNNDDKIIEETNIDNNISYRMNTNFENSESLRIKSDYTLPLKNELKINSGFLIFFFDDIKKTRDTDTSSFLGGNIIAKNNTLSYDYLSNNPSYSFYSTLSGIYKKINFKFGLRYEYESYLLNHLYPIFSLKKDFQKFYPSIHLSYQTETKHNFSLSYSRKVNTPVSHLNPYIDRSINEFISSGNQNLEFAGTNSFEFSHFKKFENGNISSSLYYRRTINDITPVSELAFDNYFNKMVVYKTYTNTANSTFLGSEINISLKFFEKLNVNFYVNTYYKDLKGVYKSIDVNQQNFDYTGKIIFTYKLFNVLNIKISPCYVSENKDIFNSYGSDFFVNGSLNFDILKKRISFDVRAEDILNTKMKISRLYYDDFYGYSESNYQFQKVQFTIIFRIGNSNFENNAKINELTR
jgi:hypothetical protein